MRIIPVLTLLTIGLAFGHAQPSSPEIRLAARHRNDGRLVRILGPATAPAYESSPATTHYIMYAQASHAPVWIGATANSLVYGTSSRQMKTALTGEPRAISISPDGTRAAVLVGTTITSYFLRSFPMLSSRYSIEGLPDAAGGVDITVTNGEGIWFSTADATFSAGIDRKFSPFAHRLTLLRPLPNKRGTVAYDPVAKAIVLVRQGKGETLGASNAEIVLPSAMELTADGRLLWISQSGGDALASISLETGEVRTFAMDDVGTIKPTAEPGLYVWSEQTLLDTRNGAPRLLPIAAAQ